MQAAVTSNNAESHTVRPGSTAAPAKASVGPHCMHVPRPVTVAWIAVCSWSRAILSRPTGSRPRLTTSTPSWSSDLYRTAHRRPVAYTVPEIHGKAGAVAVGVLGGPAAARGVAGRFTANPTSMVTTGASRTPADA